MLVLSISHLIAELTRSPAGRLNAYAWLRNLVPDESARFMYSTSRPSVFMPTIMLALLKHFLIYATWVIPLSWLNMMKRLFTRQIFWLISVREPVFMVER